MKQFCIVLLLGLVAALSVLVLSAQVEKESDKDWRYKSAWYSVERFHDGAVVCYVVSQRSVLNPYMVQGISCVK
jgi:hypothetical protein